jgi:VWFA-related protein
LEQYLREKVDPGTMVALLGLGRGGLRMYHDMTSDTKGLALELQVAMEKGRHSISTNLAQETDDTESQAAFVGHGEFSQTGSSGRSSKKLIILDTLAAFRNIAGAYANIPGRKSLVWVTGGFPFTIDGSKAGSNGMPSLDQDSLEDILPDYQKTWQALNDSNIALYPVDMHGLVNTAMPPASYKTRGSGGGSGGSGRGNGGSHGGGRSRGGGSGGGNSGSLAQQLGRYEIDKQNRLEDNYGTFQTFALETGGKSFYNNNDLTEGFRQAVDDSKSSYLLGYSLEDNAAPGWHSLHVDVNQHGAQVRARTGFLVPKTDAAHQQSREVQDSDVQQAMKSPMNFTGIPLVVKWLGTDEPAKVTANGAAPGTGKRTVKFQITISPHGLQVDLSRQPSRISLNLVGLARTREVADAADFVKKIDGSLKPDAARRVEEVGIKFDSSMALEPGYYNVRFVVRDNLSGHLGSVTAPVQVK